MKFCQRSQRGRRREEGERGLFSWEERGFLLSARVIHPLDSRRGGVGGAVRHGNDIGEHMVMVFDWKTTRIPPLVILSDSLSTNVIDENSWYCRQPVDRLDSDSFLLLSFWDALSKRILRDTNDYGIFVVKIKPGSDLLKVKI